MQTSGKEKNAAEALEAAGDEHGDHDGDEGHEVSNASRVAMGYLRIEKIPGESNVSDVLTKSVTSVVLARHAATLGLAAVRRSKLQKKAG